MEGWNLSEAKWKPIEQSVTDTEDDVRKRSEKRRTTECFELSNNYLYRRAYGESKLFDCFGLDDFKQGSSYHVITGGNVDSLSFLKLILRHTGSLDYLMLSTWCMAAEDIKQIDDWLEEGVLNRLDCYLGEIFPRTYKIEWQMINRIFAKRKCGRVVCFNNHSKIYAGNKGDFHFCIESSANINTNPRTEQTCITIDKGLSDFYINYFSRVRDGKN